MSVVAVNAVRASTDDYVERTDYLATGSVIDEIAWVTSGGISYLDVAGRPKTRGILTVVGVVSPSRLHVTPGGNWNPKYNELKKAKFQFTLVPPDPDSSFHPHFALALEKLRTLQGRVAQTTGNRKYLLVEEDGIPGIRLNQDMFEPRRVPMVEDGTDATMRWPLDGAARDALVQVAPYHCIRPLMAYDFEDRLVDPRFMESTLAGALVEVNFWLRHMSLTDKTGKVDIYTGFVEQIRVLRKAIQPEPSVFRANPSAGPIIFGRARAPPSSLAHPLTPPTTPSPAAPIGALETIHHNTASPSPVTTVPSVTANGSPSSVPMITSPAQAPLTAAQPLMAVPNPVADVAPANTPTSQSLAPPPVHVSGEDNPFHHNTASPSPVTTVPSVTANASPSSVQMITSPGQAPLNAAQPLMAVPNPVADVAPANAPTSQPLAPPAVHVSSEDNPLPQTHTPVGPTSGTVPVVDGDGPVTASLDGNTDGRQVSSTVTRGVVTPNPALSTSAGEIESVVGKASVETNTLRGTQAAPVTPSQSLDHLVQTPMVHPSPITPTMTTPPSGNGLPSPSYTLAPSPLPHAVGKANSSMSESFQKSGAGLKGKGKRVADDTPGGEPSRKTRNMTARGQ
ncbi:hypothetical protein CC1G_14049 [Coprinopsis cinerea okayama7|uniref:Uncharacterized protein n=1 Tax=Coprinopsis cinerea (strain Okayama-7 / 130 / ATCC MYA-4618 / FGSC 9003) TaxID=240176 RepID=D6RL25_COPC7|nr:hypothetical protein CC1G_14049 [Coprinopsis cinerea okayama7\|eukprot:XP_002912011.1 hypothetical protein CC1G_14049 [Coprinopsis cinerea okayama7\